MNNSKLSFDYKWPLLLVLLVAAGLWFLWEGIAESQPPRHIYESPGQTLSLGIIQDSSTVNLKGLSQEALTYLDRSSTNLSEIVSVYALPKSEWSENAIPADGSWSIAGESIVFKSRHHWLHDVNYYVRVDGEQLADQLGQSLTERVIDTSFRLSRASDLEPERVAAVYPSADTLPQNLLKFYIHFSGPMARGESYEHIYILNENGEVIPDAFLELPQELWDPKATRLTILFDPGRIKRGLARHNLMGVAFEPGKQYSLVVDSTMTDGNGLPTGNRFKKTFTITQPDREMPDPGKWSIIPPESGSKATLQLTLDEPMDHALLKRLITVKRNGTAVSGDVKTTQSEKCWHFKPEQPWNPGNYTIEIEPILEDLAGNNLISVFDVEVTDSTDNSEQTQQSVVIKEFSIRHPG